MPAASHAPLRIVQSRQNPRVKQLRAALARPSAEWIGLEGIHLLEEALRSGLTLQTIFVRDDSEALLRTIRERLGARGAARLARVPEILAVSLDVLQSAVTTEAPQPIAALAVPPSFSLDQVLGSEGSERLSDTEAETRVPGSTALVVVLAGLQDPGNVGAILRSAEAFGATGILALPGTASVWNSKSLRASMGSAFRLPHVACPADEAIGALAAYNVHSVAAVGPSVAALEAALAPRAIDLTRATALWIGSEGAGLAPKLITQCHALVSIPCPGPVESLNAAVAAAILLYEASTQRRAHTTTSRSSKGHQRPL